MPVSGYQAELNHKWVAPVTNRAIADSTASRWSTWGACRQSADINESSSAAFADATTIVYDS